jgi:hypothetical protein
MFCFVVFRLGVVVAGIQGPRGRRRMPAQKLTQAVWGWALPPMQSKGLCGFFRSDNLGFGSFSGPNRPQEGLEKTPGTGPDRFAPFFSPADQF